MAAKLMPTFRVMTYNILYGGVGREQLVRDVVSAVHPDVAVFTEVTRSDSFESIAEVVGPHRVAGASRVGREFPVIVSRWPILQSDRHGPFWAPRRWVEATLRPFGGPPVNIHGVHLVPQPLWPFELWRCWEVASLVRRLGSRPGASQIVAGDFNALMAGDTFRRDGAPARIRMQWAIQGGWPRWALRGMIDAGYIDCYRACRAEDGFTVPAWNPGVRIDYIFASPDLKRAVRAADTVKSTDAGGSTGVTPSRSLAELLGWKMIPSLGGAASDHLPVWADFEWPCGDAPGADEG